VASPKIHAFYMLTKQALHPPGLIPKIPLSAKLFCSAKYKPVPIPSSAGKQCMKSEVKTAYTIIPAAHINKSLGGLSPTTPSTKR
jgi:hypothetical protein